MVTKVLNDKGISIKRRDEGYALLAGRPVTNRYEAVSTAAQTVINLSFAVEQDKTDNFFLYIDGVVLKEGATADYTFTSVVNNKSSEITLNTPLLANLNILATNLGTVLSSVNTSTLQADINTSGANSSKEISNLGIATSVAASSLTINIVDKDGATPSASSDVRVAFRDSTITTGEYSRVSINSALSMTISSGSTLGFASGRKEYLFVYLINNAGTAEIAVSKRRYDEGALVSTTAEGGAGAADSATTIYSTTARSNVALRLVGRILFSLTTAGTWDEAGDELSLQPFGITEELYDSHATNITGSTTASTYTDAELSHTLTEGYWMLEVHMAMHIVTASGSGATAVLGRITITDNSNIEINDINGSDVDDVCLMSSSADQSDALGSLSIKAKVYISSEETYKVRFAAVNNSGSPTITSVTGHYLNSLGTFTARKLEG